MNTRILLPLILLTLLAVACTAKDRKQAMLIDPLLLVVDTVTDVKQAIADADDLFARKIMDNILNSDEYFGIDCFEKSDWKIADRSQTFDIAPYLKKESHYYGKRKGHSNSNRIAVDYYRLNDSLKARQCVDSYIKQWTWAEGEGSDAQYTLNDQGVSVDSLGYTSDMATWIYQRGATVFFVRTYEDNRAVREGLKKVDKSERIGQGSTISAWTISSKEQQERDRLPFIDNNLAKKLAPKMKRWLSVYKLDVSKFKAISTSELEDWNNDLGSMYYREFDPKTDNVYLPKEYDYSPDKSMYVDVIGSRGAYLENDTLKYYGGDDCQSVYLTSRPLKKKVMIIWLGAGATVEDCFWIDNTRFVLVGYDYVTYSNSFFKLYNLKDKTTTTYSFQHFEKPNHDGVNYFTKHNLASRGCPVQTDE